METNRPTNTEAEKLINLYFPVLDNGFISLKDYMGIDTSVEEAARASYQEGTRKTSDTSQLIRYLYRHEHGTPLEMVDFKFHICMPIFVMRQLIRHRISSTNEMSGRYSLLPMVFYTPEHDKFNKQSKNNKQGRAEVLSSDLYKNVVDRWNKQREIAEDNYKFMTDNDVAKELARIDLPLSIYTQFYWKINLRSLFNFLKLRTDSHAQYEIREYANIMAGIVRKLVPIAYQAWIDYEVCAETFGKEEMRIIRQLLSIDNSVLSASSLSKREKEEFIEKLQYKDEPVFELDISKARTGEYFEDLFKRK